MTDKNEKNYITVVFEYEDGAELPRALSKEFSGDKPFYDCKIVAMSFDDEISKIERLEESVIDMYKEFG